MTLLSLFLSTTIFFAGDSTLHSRAYSDATATNRETTCLGSWCDELADYIKPTVEIRNLALSGLSTRSYLEDGHWELLVSNVQAGDFVYLQFGHNDQKLDTRHGAPAKSAYRANLTRFANDVRARGAFPVFGTPMVRRFFDADGKVANTLGDYPETVRCLGRELNVPVFDFNALSRRLVEGASRDESLAWYRAAVNKTDMTHPTKLGAKVFARAFVDQIKKDDFILAPLFRGRSALGRKIAATRKIIREDIFHGYARTVFDFEGYEAWVVEPSSPTHAGMPWTWTMQWAGAFVPRTPCLKMLAQGWHHVTIDTFKHRMNQDGLRVSAAYQNYLVRELGFAPKACLIGMSWGGFFSTRYAAANPQNVAAIYYDAPLMNFEKFRSIPPEKALKEMGPWGLNGLQNWRANPEMPINLAEKVAAARIPVLLLYGADDRVVPPETNCEIFAARYKAAGGPIEVVRRVNFAHHPHGVEESDTSIADFFATTVK